jgi:surface antigen
MRHAVPMETCVLVAVTGFVLAATVFLFDTAAFSQDLGNAGSSPCACADQTAKPASPTAAAPVGEQRPGEHRLTEHRLDEADEIAALESIQMGLSRMVDGEPFVWRRANGRLSGIVRPTVSFRNKEGTICRHVVVLLTTGFKTRTAEGIACRSPNRRWVLEG